MVAKIRVRCRPPVTDPKEFETILRCSIRYIFGDLERISHALTAMMDDKDGLMVVQCSPSSLPQVRSALTMVTPPPYLKDTLYSFDVVDVNIESE
jgi:hypothetical protein